MKDAHNALKMTGTAMSAWIAPFINLRVSGHLLGFLREEWYNGNVGERACILWPAIVVAYRGRVGLQPRGYTQCKRVCECLFQGGRVHEMRWSVSR